MANLIQKDIFHHTLTNNFGNPADQLRLGMMQRRPPNIMIALNQQFAPLKSLDMRVFGYLFAHNFDPILFNPREPKPLLVLPVAQKRIKNGLYRF